MPQPDVSKDPTLPADSKTQPQPIVAARGQRPWHQPKLTQVAFQVTGQGSGQSDDGQTPASTTGKQ